MSAIAAWIPRGRAGWISFTGWVAVGMALLLYWRQQVLPLRAEAIPGVAASASHANDFKHLYLGALLLREGNSPYDAVRMLGLAGEMGRTEDVRFQRGIMPYVYLPFTGIVLRPLTWVPFSRAVAMFQWLNHAALIGALIFAIHAATPRGRRHWIFAGALALAATSLVVFRQNNAGQLNNLLLLGFSAVAFLWVRRTPPWAAGIAAAFFALFKLTPGILAPLFLLQGDRKSFWWMTGGGVLLLALSLLAVAPSIHLAFVPELSAMSYGNSTWAEYGSTFWRDPYNQSFNALFHRLLVERQGSGITPWLSLPPIAANGLTWAVTIGLIGAWVASMIHWTDSDESKLPALASAVCLNLLIPSILWDHYLVQLFLPAILLWNPPRPVCGCHRRDRILILGALWLAGLQVRLDDPAFRQGIGLLAMSCKLLPPLMLFVLSLLVLRKTAESKSAYAADFSGETA